MSESVILCEGYHDRAFWAGWLAHLGCSDPGAPLLGSSRRRRILDPWQDRVEGGQYAYLSRTGQFLRVIPCNGKDKILAIARDRLNERSRKPLVRLVLNVDADTTASGVHTATGLRLQDVEQYIRANVDPGATRNAAEQIEVDGGNTLVCLIRWEVTDLPTPALPDQQTLERLACAAIVAAYPARAAAVQNWLGARPHPPGVDPKEHAWSYMAGWYAQHGCDSFYSNLWNDPQVIVELTTRLQASGAWHLAAMLVS
jgi:hypothetical protein